MTDFVGDNDHGDTLPPAEVLFKEVLELRKQRDEARREVCHLMRSDDYNEPFEGTVFEYAIYRGWDCFKGNDND